MKLEDERENFRGSDGKPFVVRCPSCKRENHGAVVASGQCAWCGWLAAPTGYFAAEDEQPVEDS